MGKKKQTTKQQKNIDRKNRRTGLKRTPKKGVQSQRDIAALQKQNETRF